MDARQATPAAVALKDCVRPVEVVNGDGARTLEEMRRAGARLTTEKATMDKLAGTQQ